MADEKIKQITSKPIRVMIVDDHDLVREGIRSRLELNKNVMICAEAKNGAEACMIANELAPDLIFLDISMPGMTGLEAAEKILENCPSSKIIFLSIYDNPEYIQEALKIGAKGYILKDISCEEMMTALNAVYSGGTYLGSKVAMALSTNDQKDKPCGKYNLTSREKEILQMIAQGETNKEIANNLAISVRTVESHRLSIRDKTGGGNAASLTYIAQEIGLLSNTS